MANTKSFCGTSVAKRKRGPTALEQVAWLRLGPGLASNRNLHHVSLDILSNLCWTSTGHFQGTYRTGYTFLEHAKDHILTTEYGEHSSCA